VKPPSSLSGEVIHSRSFARNVTTKTLDSATYQPASLRVLVMHGDEIYLEQLRRALGSEIIGVGSIHVMASHDPVTAISWIEEDRFDLFVLDFHMPRLDGMCFLKWLNAGEHFNVNVPKVVLTEDPEIPDRVRTNIVENGARVMAKGDGIDELKVLAINTLRTKQRMVHTHQQVS